MSEHRNMPISWKGRTAQLRFSLGVATVILAACAGTAAGCSDTKPTTAEPTPTGTAAPPVTTTPRGGVDGGGPGGGGGGDSGLGSTADPKTVCGKVTHGAAGVEELAEMGMPPPATGGAIAPGRYVLTQVNGYVPDGGGPTGYLARKTLLFGETGTFGFLQSEGDTTEGVGQSTVTGGTYTIEQTNLVMKEVCPDDIGTIHTYPFSASGGRVALQRGVNRWELYQRK